MLVLVLENKKKYRLVLEHVLVPVPVLFFINFFAQANVPYNLYFLFSYPNKRYKLSIDYLGILKHNQSL